MDHLCNLCLVLSGLLIAALSVSFSLVVTCRERADLLALVYDV